tara:strand:- start:2614 stop:3129 length:516 start_codon:yes stop_codon:yes gene_type:complete
MTIGIYNIIHKDNPEKCYIGSSKNCERRFTKHKYCIKNNIKNYKVYETIRADGIENYTFDIIGSFDEYNEFLLKEKEQWYISTIKPALNMRNAYLTASERREMCKRLWDARNKIDVICECGCKVKKTHIRRHERTKKHKKILIDKKVDELIDLVGCDDKNTLSAIFGIGNT